MRLKEIINNIEIILSKSLPLGSKLSISIGGILLLILTLIFTYFLLKLVRRIILSRLREEDRIKFNSFFSFIKYFIYTIVLIVTLSSIGINVTVLLAGSTALFVGLGLGMQKLFQDIISGVFILIDKTVSIKDIIEIDGMVGRVTDISLRTTRAITRDDKVLMIPNHKFMNENVYNWTQNSTTSRESVSVGVSYDSDSNNIKDILLNISNSHKEILKHPKPYVYIDSFDDSAINFTLYYFINNSFINPKIASDVRFKILEEFNSNNITIPFPQRVIHLKK